MNTKKLIIAVIAVFVLLEASNYLIHNVILASTYMDNSISLPFRSNEEMDSKMWVMWVVDLIWSFFFVFIFVKGYQNKGIMEGVRYGIYIGLFVHLVAAYAQFAVYPLPYSLIFQWFIYGFIQSIIFGVVTALIYKPAVKTV